MENSIPERDWKYLRRIKPELLSILCRRINLSAAKILRAKEESEHDKYIKLYKHIEESDCIIADCFNDWRRSNIRLKLHFLIHHRLLTDEQIENLSQERKFSAKPRLLTDIK